ncbi:MAG: PIN domain-containing protein [Candidatus Bathyarchaeia archaeon]
MILDTTYLLPLALIQIDTDLLRAIADKKANLKLEEITVNMISLFELQAKAAKLMVPAKFVVDAIKAISMAFKVESFNRPEIVETAYEVKKIIPDYIDCVIISTAAVLKEDLITEDSRILSKRERLKKEYGVNISSYKDLVTE